MKFLKNAKQAAKDLPKPLWFAAVILPMGMVTLATYIAVKAYCDKNKENKDEPR